MDDLVKYRLDMAEERLNSSRILLDAGQYKDSIGRSYYAIFSAVRAVLATNEVDFSKHFSVSKMSRIIFVLWSFWSAFFLT